MSTAKRTLDNMASSRGRRRASGKMYATMSGVEDITLALQNLNVPDKAIFDILSMRIAPRLIDSIRTLVPKKTGALLRSIQMFRSKRDAYRRIWVGPRYTGNWSSPDAGNHAHLVEFGTAERQMKVGLIYGDTAKSTYKKFAGPWFYKPFKGKSTGKVTGLEFMQRALEQNKQWVIAEGQAAMAEALLNEAKRKGLNT